MFEHAKNLEHEEAAALSDEINRIDDEYPGT
ncbi:MAG: UvrB/UvrC motif-containing protein [Spirochaetales bacterium]|nr:UvrB/UvrC motif-containing protein [Spirochaetales bacterium]